mmetsp:Transcript_1950/g.2366  ORF Transcript_1950/g.2366 Transcript_1950/m.2366 type:complete len:305 (-) Transcript_1950:33-947(-)
MQNDQIQFKTLRNISTMSQLAKCVVNPSKVASILNWNKAACTIMSLDIRKKDIGVAIAKHPYYHSHSEYNSDKNLLLDALQIPYETSTTHEHNAVHLEQHQQHRQKKQSHDLIVKDSTLTLRQGIESIVSKYKVCAFLVHWPISSHGGRCGESCGRVLHILDDLATTNTSNHTATSTQPSSSSSSSLFNSCNTNDSIYTSNDMIHTNRPFALYTSNDYLDQILIDVEDNWGRNPHLSNTSEHFSFSSKSGVVLNSITSRKGDIDYDNNDQDGGDFDVASTILKEFLHHHWFDTNNVMYHMSSAA